MLLYVTCDTDEEINAVFEKLSQNRSIIMPLASYPSSEKHAWVKDKYDVTCQLNLEKIQ